MAIVLVVIFLAILCIAGSMGMAHKGDEEERRRVGEQRLAEARDQQARREVRDEESMEMERRYG